MKHLKVFFLNCKLSQQDNTQRNHCTPLQYAQEYCTIRMATSRRGGHTSAIASLCKEISGNWIITSPFCWGICKEKIGSDNIYRITQNSLTCKNDLELSFESIYSITKEREIEDRGRIEPVIDGIIVDCGFWLKKNDEKALYKSLIPKMRNEERYFIFVG